MKPGDRHRKLAGHLKKGNHMRLFEKSQINETQLDNRSVRSATWSAVADSKGFVTDLAADYYRRVGAGGVGLVITGFQYVMPNGIAMKQQLGNYTDDMTSGLARLADAVRAENGKIAAQLVHTGAKANPDLFPEEGEVWGPSAVPDPMTGRAPKEVSRDEIIQLIQAYADAARRCRDAGFDGVQLHGAHGYGINQFLSPISNRRGDAYGGDLNDRYRFLGETLEAVRGAVGKDFPVFIKLAGHDFIDGGLTTDDALVVARKLAEDGIDAIEVSAGSRASKDGKIPSRLHVLKTEDEAYLADLAEAVKKVVSVPIVSVGGYRTPEVIESVLAQGKADLIAFCRPLIREPDLINRWKTGDTSKATCISCNGCFETADTGTGITCKIDLEAKEKE
jgi:2,4-dienoyl-CoA reductase-like NADH-dependent reductase (Old Yellow Enzyme family)